MRTSDTITAIAPDMVKAVGDIKAIKKDATNGFFKSKYATLDAIIEGIKDILKAHNICAIQTVTNEGIETILIHSSGEWIASGTMSINAETGRGQSLAQAWGVSITYAKRYQLGAMLGIATDEDTDGDNKEGSAPPKDKAPATPPTPPAPPAPKSPPPQAKKPIPADRMQKLGAYIAERGPSPEVNKVIADARAMFTFTPEQERYIAQLLDETNLTIHQ